MPRHMVASIERSMMGRVILWEMEAFRESVGMALMLLSGTGIIVSRSNVKLRNKTTAVYYCVGGKTRHRPRT
jgi:hypothetical protein